MVCMSGSSLDCEVSWQLVNAGQPLVVPAGAVAVAAKVLQLVDER